MSGRERMPHMRLRREIIEGLSIAEYGRETGILSEDDARAALWLWIAARRYARRNFVAPDSVYVEIVAQAKRGEFASRVEVRGPKATVTVVDGGNPLVRMSMEALTNDKRARKFWKRRPELVNYRWVWDLTEDWEEVKVKEVWR